MPTSSPIEHVVIILKENHTFDNFFGTFPNVTGDPTLQQFPPGMSRPDPMATSINHESWIINHKNPANNKGQGNMQFVEQHIPKYFEYARNYTLCDNYFSEVAGPSWPNHMMLLTADSPIIDNPLTEERGVPRPWPSWDVPSLPRSLDNAHPVKTWKNYDGDATDTHSVFGLIGLGNAPVSTDRQFIQDAQNNDLPNFSFVRAPHHQSEHPPYDRVDNWDYPSGDVNLGMRWTVECVEAVKQKQELFSKTVIFVTWDDWGGWYDSVKPPPVETWHETDTSRQVCGSHPSYEGTQFRYGSRVPCLVISPFAKKGHISKSQFSHVSLLRFCELIFGLPNLNDRDKNADPMTDCFPPQFWTNVHT